MKCSVFRVFRNVFCKKKDPERKSVRSLKIIELPSFLLERMRLRLDFCQSHKCGHSVFERHLNFALHEREHVFIELVAD